MDTHDCPVCLKPHQSLARYPTAVCNDCLRKYPSVNSEGQRVEFGNINLSGGFYCKNLVSGLMYNDEQHLCYINDVMCVANESNFGDIIISAIEK